MATERITSTAGTEEASSGLGALASLDRRRRERAFARMYANHHQELFRYCLSILRNREDAEDALQATMAAALRSLPGEKREIALRPWLFRVAHNESISLLRTRRPTAELDERSGPAGPTAEAALEERDRLRQLVVDLRALPERQNAALVMRELSGLSYEEIGAALSSSEGAARQAVYEGRVALRTREEGREMECEIVRRAISDRDGRRLRGRALRAHLETCDGCHAFAASIDRRRTDLAALCPPIPALAAAGVFSGVLGGGSAGGAAAGAAGVSAASATGVAAVGGGVAGSLAIKGVTLVAAVGIAAGAADIGGAIDITHPFGGGDSGGGSAAPAPPVEAPRDRPRSATGHGTTAPVGGDPAKGHGGREASGRPGSHPGGSADAPGRGGPKSGKPDTAPGQAGTTSPGKPGDAPGHAETSPGVPGTVPGNAGTSEGDAATSPGTSAEAPGQSGSSPGNSESAPGQTGDSPGKSETAPGHTGTAPGQSGTAPGHSGTAPGQTGGSPGNSGSAPGHAVVPPTPPATPVPGNGNGPPATSPGATHGNSPK